ncbi:MAG: hypothetical protein FWD55_07345 [Propionibacteriaceae bacterium]|nr:hypothetical protein [Propionibacteriaceae bacterium]
MRESMTAAAKKTRFVLLLVALAGALIVPLAGCTDADDTPTPGQTGNTASKKPNIEFAATAFYNCMFDAGLPVELTPNSEGILAIVKFTGDHTILIRGAEGGYFIPSSKFSYEMTEEMRQTMDDFFASSEPGLMIDGEDYTGVYGRCLRDSGYDETDAFGSVQMDPVRVTRQVEANDAWAACARRNDWPEIYDSSESDSQEFGDWPVILIPLSITPSQLRQLLSACPNFDPAKQGEIDQWWRDHPTATSFPETYIPDPNIDFRLPVVGEKHAGPTPVEFEDLDLGVIAQLFEILYETQTQYWDQQRLQQGFGI